MGCLTFVGCGDDSSGGDGGTATTGGTGDTTETEDTGGPVIEDDMVPLDLAELPLEALCFDLDVAPMQSSVSPEGHLWLRQDEQTWRVLDPFGDDQQQVLPPGVTVLQARGHDRALVIDGGALWDVQGEWPQPLAWPESLAEPTALCGDPSLDGNGFVLAQGLLHRDAGKWWEWTSPDGASWAEVAWMARSAGVCLGGDGDLWLAETTGEVWQITGDFAARVEPFDGAEQAVLADGLGAAAAVDGDLLVGDAETIVHYQFEAGEVSQLAAGGEATWVVVDGALLRFAGEEFMAARVDGEAPTVGELWAEAGGGLWSVTADQACHLRPGPPVRVSGVHDLQRLVSDSVDVAVEVASGVSVESASLDGEALTLEDDGTGRQVAPSQEIAEGWHTLEVVASAADGGTTRRVRFEQRRVGDLTWTGNVEPLFLEHCSGAACHGPDLSDGTRPDLSTWEAWTEREAAILDRVVTKGDMPPSNARKDTWGLELQLLVSEWFETGAAQGDG